MVSLLCLVDDCSAGKGERIGEYTGANADELRLLMLSNQTAASSSESGVTQPVSAVDVLPKASNKDRNPSEEANEEEEVIACRSPTRLTRDEKRRLRSSISLDERGEYFALNKCPIDYETEQRMESVSHCISNEVLAEVWEPGKYVCSRCSHELYDSTAKFRGPCLWPSFRRPKVEEGEKDKGTVTTPSLKRLTVLPGRYNGYNIDVFEIYCGKCELFLGHQVHFLRFPLIFKDKGLTLLHCNKTST